MENAQENEVPATPFVPLAEGYGVVNRLAASLMQRVLSEHEDNQTVVPIFNLTHPVSHKQSKAIFERFRVRVHTPVIGATHLWPTIELENNMSEDIAIRHAAALSVGRTVVVCGGDANTRYDYVDQCDIWRSIDGKNTSSVMRASYTARESGWCTCKLSECCCVVADTIVYSVDAPSYDPSEIAQQLTRTSRKCAIYITRRLPEISGSLYNDELVYYRSAPTTQYLRVGDKAPIESVAPDWLDRRTPFSDIQHDLVASQLFTCGSITGYLVCLSPWLEEDWVPQYDLSDVVKWDRAALEMDKNSIDMTYALPGTSLESWRAHFDWYKFKFTQVRLLPGVVVLEGESERFVLLSKAILHRNSRMCLGKPRNHELYVQICRMVNADYSKLVNLPEEMKYRAVIATCAFIMSEAAIDEFSVLNAMNQDMSRLWEYHEVAVRGGWKPSMTLNEMLFAAGWTGVSYYALHYGLVKEFAGVATSSVIGTTKTVAVLSSFKAAVTTATVAAGVVSPHLVLGAWATATVVGGLVTAARRWDWFGTHHRRSQLEAWVGNQPGQTPPILEPGVYHLDGVAPSFGPTYRVREPNKLLHPGASLTPPPTQVERRDTKKLSLRGIAFSDVQPTYFASTPQNEYVALSHRVATPTPEPLDIWNDLAFYYRTSKIGTWIKNYIVAEALRVNRREAQRYASKFNRNQQVTLMRAYDDWAASKVLTRADLTYSAFVKVEKAVKAQFDEDSMCVVGWEYEEGKPRAIIAMKPKLSIIFGTMVMQVEERKKAAIADYKHNHGEHSPICPKGASAEEMSEWFSFWHSQFGGDVVYIFGDAESYDAGMRATAFEAVHAATYPAELAVHPLEARQALDTHELISGRSYGGIRFRSDKGLASGSSETNQAGTTANEMMQCYSLESLPSAFPVLDRSVGLLGSQVPAEWRPTSFDHLGITYAIAACGDDSFAMVSKRWFKERFESVQVAGRHISDRWKACGFNMKTKISENLFEADYLSKLWYPTKDGFILGGKIGRVFSRCGWFLDVKDELTVRGAALSSLNDNYHVPFLREYFTRVVELTHGQKVRGKTHEYSVHVSRRHDYDDSTMEFVTARYGLAKRDLVEFTQILSRVTSLPVVLSIPWVERVIVIDNA